MNRKSRVTIGVAVMLSAMWSVTAEEVSSVSKNDLTWYFSEPAEVGQYANGDYWVVGPVTIDSITPHFDGSVYGWEVNPVAEGGQGLAQDCGGFDASLVPDVPYTASPGESILKTAPTGETRPCIKTAAVLTVVQNVPTDSGETVFRPPYAGSEKPSYSAANLRTDLLPSYDPVGDVETLEKIEKRYGDVRIEHKDGLLGRELHPADYMDDNGADIGYHNAEASMRFMLDDSVSEIRTALVDYLQYGIDLYHISKLGVVWHDGGGHRPGMKLPIVFTSVMLDDDEMKTYIADQNTFSEDVGIYTGANAGIPLYGFDKGGAGEREYWEAIVTGEGNSSLRDPYGYIDGGTEPGGADQFCCTSQPWKNVVACFYLMPALREVSSDGELFVYAERWIEHGAWAQPDPCAPAGSTMAEYGVSFGPDPENPGDCIRDTDASDGTGRFPDRHGVNADAGHRKSPFITEMWNTYRSTVAASKPIPTKNASAEPRNIRVSVGSRGLRVHVARSGMEVRLSLHDLQGRTLSTRTFLSDGMPREINAPSRVSRMYILSIKTNDGLETRKISFGPK